MKIYSTKNLVLSLLLVTIQIGTQGQFVQERQISADEAEIKNQQMHIRVLDALSDEPLHADLKVSGLNPRKPVDLIAVSDTTFEIKNYRLYSITCVEPGYMIYAEKFWPDEKSLHEQAVRLEPLKPGLRTDLRDIVFLGDRTEIYHKSKPALQDFYDFLTLNPKVRICIIGHVNGPDNSRSQRVYRKASEERAEAVKDYLVKMGISPDRLEIRGAGNTEMLYPDPATDWQNEANRRIEIEVLSL